MAERFRKPLFPPEYSWHMACSVRYSGRKSSMKFSMKMRWLKALVVLGAVALAVPAWADTRSNAREQVEFGINVAQRGLWREAIYRWEKAVEIDPMYAAAYNDLGIAYEHEGQLDKARKAYEKALALEPNNAQIRQNYDLFKEINDRSVQPKDKP
ncbi:MAG TPA: tetratricopeptide repeat protein [Candidatus Eremiobacteraceae bacterium]|nr:tetratricopeptide repeat protein [Candidatus Eremiobacteraceae bacterium]